MKVFVYGTLKKGHPNHHIMGDAKFIRQDEAPGVMYNLGAFPGVIPYPWATVKGEVYDVSVKTLRNLDLLEGVPHLYTRQVVPLASGEEASIYYFNRSVVGREEVPHGEWKGK